MSVSAVVGLSVRRSPRPRRSSIATDRLFDSGTVLVVGGQVDPGLVERPWVIRSATPVVVQGVNAPGGIDEAPFFALLAVPALALGFALALTGTDEAQAYPFPDFYVACEIANMQIGYAVSQGDEVSARQIYDIAEQFGCTD